MPDISLLDPEIINGVVAKFTTPQDLALLNTVPSSPSSAPDYVTWDVLKGSRQAASFNVPNAEATVLDNLGRSQESAKLAYVRVKKFFSPTTMHWLRAPGQIAQTQAEQYVLRELTDMNQSVDLLQEQALWGALRGSFTYDLPDGATATVNYGFPSSHMVSSAVTWSTATPQNIVDDIFAWKRLITTHGRVKPTDAYCSTKTIQTIIDRWAAGSVLVTNSSVTTNATSAAMGGLMSDRMKDAYYAGGTLPGFMDLNWHGIDEVYTDSNGNLTYFVGDGSNSNAEVFIGNFTEQRPVEIKFGKTADDSAPEGFWGKFTKTWKQEDPSARIALMELHFLPIVTRPEQLVYCSNVG